MAYRTLDELNAAVVVCTKCPRLVTYREQIAQVRRRAFRDQPYWGRPLPSWGDPGAHMLIVGLAPAAHGGNRTGRMFTGDRSGDFLYAALYRAGFANQPTASSLGDGLALNDVYISAAVRCAPPDNKPAPDEFTNCRPNLANDLALLSNVRVILNLGKIAFDATLRVLIEMGVTLPSPRPLFSHGEVARVGNYTVIASYHPSQRNTSTGLLTQAMFDLVLKACVTAWRPCL